MTSMSDKVAEISDLSHSSTLMTSLRNFINTESFVDVQFICLGGHKVYAHKLILISVSRLFKKLLVENPDKNEMITIHLPDISSKLLRIIVNFLYIGSMRLNNSEMDQFKLVLELLDIELWEKPSEQNNEPNRDPLNSGYMSVPNASGPSHAANTSSTPVINNVFSQQNGQNEFLTMAQQTPQVQNIINRPQQYITVQTDQLTPSSNPGEVLIPVSAVPMISSTNSMIVQQSPTNLPPGHQSLIPEQNQYSAYTNNIVNTPTMVTHASTSSTIMQPTLIPVSMAQIKYSDQTPSNIQVQSPMVVQAGLQTQQQPLVQYLTPQKNNVVTHANFPPSSSGSTQPVQQNQDRPTSLPPGHHSLIPQQNQYSTYTNNTVNAPVMATHATASSNTAIMQPTLIPVSMMQMTPSNISAQQPMVVQAASQTQQQQLVQYLTSQKSNLVNHAAASNISSGSLQNVQQNQVQFQSQQLGLPQIQHHTPVQPKTEHIVGNVKNPQNQMISKHSSSQIPNKSSDSHRSKNLNKSSKKDVDVAHSGVKRKLVQARVEAIIDLSEDDGTESPRKPNIINVHSTQNVQKSGKLKRSRGRPPNSQSSRPQNSQSSGSRGESSKDVIIINP